MAITLKRTVKIYEMPTTQIETALNLGADEHILNITKAGPNVQIKTEKVA